MPFKSEKQRKYLWANEPEIARAWTDTYGSGIQAAQGGRIGFAKGRTDSYAGDHTSSQADYGYGAGRTTPDRGSDHGHTRFDVGSGYYGEPITKPTPDTGEWSGDVEEEFIGPRWESYNKKEWVNVERNHYEDALATQKKKMINMGLGKLIMPAIAIAFGIPVKAALKGITVNPKDLMTAVQHSLPVMKAKKDLIAALEDYKGDLLKDVNIHNPNEMVNLEKTTDFTKTMNQLKDLTKISVTEDPKGDGGPELPPQLGGPSTEEMAIEYDWMGAIREKQAQKKAYDEKIERERLAREDNPIVSGTEMDIIALGNSGGLANLFRVKNQQQEKNMRNDFGSRPYKSRFPYDKGGSSKQQGYNARLDESLGARRGAESTKSQSLKSRRDESKGAEKAAGKRAYSAVGTMDK